MRKIIRNVPYYSQWESNELVGKFVNGKLNSSKDPNWKTSGADSPAEYQLWSQNACGMACVKMILAYKTQKEIPIVRLGKKCLEYGGYKLRKKTIDGMFYHPFLEFIKNEFGLSGSIVEPLSIKDIETEIKKNNFAIASVHHSIRNPSSNPPKKGGHLVLLLGFDSNKKRLYFHNPSGTTKISQKYAKITYKEFIKFFSGRGIVIKNN
jgi:hypothetical protein